MMLGLRVWVCSTACVLLLATACDSGSADTCATCARSDAGDAASNDAATTPDASAPVDAGPDAAALDATTDDAADATAEDAAQRPDAELEAGDPVYTECATKEDCVLPEGVLACQRCTDGSMACPEAGCVDRLCVFSVPKPCAEQDMRATCTSDDDCWGGACDLLCQGDGRNACQKSRCREGRCQASYWTCGLHDSRCPEGTRAGQECAACGDGGVCSARVLGCFDACKTAQDCPGEVGCVDGLCRLQVCQ